MNQLEEIIDHKRREVEQLLPRTENLRQAAAARNDFRSLYNALAPLPEGGGSLGVIAEIKKASPSAGIIAEHFDPETIAAAYERAGASAISVLTDEKYFLGALSHLTVVRQKVSIPVLRKDFIVHEAQVFEAVVAGADAILLIVAALDQQELVRLLETAHTYQLDVLVEVHDLEELDRALDTDARIIGINNRDLATFEVDLETTRELSEEIDAETILVSESGIRSGEDAALVREWGADAILVGEALMRADDVEEQIAEFKGE
ncbi:MAG: indole-3-glycerol phosphate synthase TrpC [Verrucomicrobiales bacterium]